MGRWLALLSTAALIIAAAGIDPCKRQPFRGRCPSVGGQPPKRSQFVLRYYARNGECVSYPYGHCATDESEPQLYRYKEECEDSCINNTPANLGQPKDNAEDNQTYGTVSPAKAQKESPVEVVEKKTSITSPPVTSTTSESTTSATTTEKVTTTEKTTTTEEPTTEKITTQKTESPTITTHATTESVTETTEVEEEVEEEDNNVEEEEPVQETTTTPAPTTTRAATTSAARTECERRREASASSKIRGGFVPVCEANGNFQKVQCEPDGRQCFCVNTNGIEITNSRTRNGVRPDCARIETAVTPRTQSCTGRSDRGPCSSSYTRFYYDEATQRCSTFSYSGCGGNGNNFVSESECNRRCVSSKPVTTPAPPTPAPSNDICALPKERGPCDKYELRFYFNADTKECKYFFWGGCEGNGNNFETAEQCQASCGVAKPANPHNVARTSSQNNGQIKTIPGVRIGNGSVVTNGADQLEVVASSTARPTSATPPLPPRTAPPTLPTTRFIPQTVQTRAPQPPQPPKTIPPQTTRLVPQTTPAPVPPPTPAPIPPSRPAPVILPGDSEEVDVNRCDHPLDSGSCRGQFVRWYWDDQKQACDVFTYSGCEGNGNNFVSREECMAICQREQPPPPPPDFSNVCKHEIDAGECQGVFQRFAFDTEEGECRPFTYGGCGGNGNNFATLAECRTKCEKPPSQAVNVCEFEIEAGECTGVFPRFAYDRETNDCRPFTYGGCGGNGNNFATVAECRNICIKKACKPIGQCDLGHCQVLNDSRGCPFCSCAPVKVPAPVQCPPMDMNRCMEPCIVITNRRGCQECACPSNVPAPTTAQSPVPPREPGPPSPSTQPPRPPGHPTKIKPPASPSHPSPPPRTIPGVESTRTPLSPGFTAEIQEKCLQPMESGPCKSFSDRWFFSSQDGACRPFKYGGCAGNRNHFFTQRECEIHCARFLHPLETNELTTSTSHEHDARDSSQELAGTRSQLGQQRALAFDLPSVVKGQQSLQLEHSATTTGPETYETLAPIKADMEKRITQETTATRSHNTVRAQEYTTRAYRERTEPPPKVSLPVEGYTQTIITTRHPQQKPLEPIPEELSEEEEEEEVEEEPTTERPRPVIPKKIPLRQEGARTETGGTRPLSHQNTYSMPAVTNYDPQVNSNLEGLSPPVDPTYFTYNSQHLGRRKQFAVNSVPFDKANAPNPAGFATLGNRPQPVVPRVAGEFREPQQNVPPQNLPNGPRNLPTAVNQQNEFNGRPVANQVNRFNPQAKQIFPQFTQFEQQQQQQHQFVQQRTNFNQQSTFVPPQQNNFNTPRSAPVVPNTSAGGNEQQPLRAHVTSPPRVEPTRPNEARSTTPQQQSTFAPRQQTTASTWRPPPPSLAALGVPQELPRFEDNHFSAPHKTDFTTERTVTRQETREPVKFIPSQRNAPSNVVSPSTRSSARVDEPRFEEDKFRYVSSQGPRFVMEEYSPEEPVQPARSRASQTMQTTQGSRQFVTETPRPTIPRTTVDRQVLPKVPTELLLHNSQPNKPVRQTFQPLQNAVKTAVTQEKLPLNALPIHRIGNVTPTVPKRIQHKEHGSEEKVPIVHGIRSGPYGQSHWVYFDGDYYGPLIPGFKVNRTAVEKIDATVTVKGNPSHQAAYESFKSQAANFQKSLDLYIKQKEQEQLKKQTAAQTTTTRIPFSKSSQGVVMIPLESGPNEEPVVIPVLRTENVRFKDVNKHAEQKPLTKNIEKGEESEETSREDEEIARRPVAHGVSRVRVVEPLPVENYHSPEPILRGAYGKKNYLEPATTQGVKITTSTARPTTTTTTASTTTSTTTVRTTTEIEETDDEAEDVEEEQPEEVTTTSSTAAATTEQPREEFVEPKEIEREESSAQEQQRSQHQPESEHETEEDEEPEEIPELNTVPTSRASRLPAPREESKTEEDETEEEVGEENLGTPIRPSPAEVDITKPSAETESESAETAVKSEPTTGKPDVETTLFNEVNSMEGEEGVEENEITPSSMMSSSKFAVHRETEEENKFEEITADLKSHPDQSAEVTTSKPGLKKVEITRPTTGPSTATAPTNETPSSTETAADSVSTTAEASTTSGTIQPKTLNIDITDSTTSVSSTASTTQTPTTVTTTQSRATTTETDSNENEPDFDLNAVKPADTKKAQGVAQQPVQKAVDPTSGVGRQPIPNVPLLPDDSLDLKDLDLEEPTTIFPSTKAPTTVRQALAPTQASNQNTVAQSSKAFNSHDPKIICSMPAEQGLCNNFVARWFFNYQTGQCEEFSFGGCSGNLNNFVNRTLCELTCMPVHSVTSQVPERCSYEKDAGFGKGYNVKWYFNMRNLRCEQYVYEGKGGNDNKFETLSDCERFCAPQPARPVTPRRPALITVPTVPAQAATTVKPAVVTPATLPTASAAHVQTPTNRPVPPAAPAPTATPTVAPKGNPLVELPTDSDNDVDPDEEYEEEPDDSNSEPMPPVAGRAFAASSYGPDERVPTPLPPGTEPQPPSAHGSPVKPVEKPHPIPVAPTTAQASASRATVAPAAATEPPVYKAKKIDQTDMEPREPNLPVVAPSPKEDVSYSTGQRNKAAGLPNFENNRLPPPDLDAKNENEKVARPSCPNGNKELRYLDGRPVMCLPGKAQCPDKAVCYFNGMDYFCCPNEEDPYDRHVFGGYGGDEARYGYKVFGPLRISRLMDEVPLRAKRQTSMDRAFNANSVAFSLDSVVAPLRFDAEKPKHVSSAVRMSRPTVPKHGNPMCILPLVKGDCDAAHLRYYYDRNSDSCRLFYYSGCQGNANNFGSLIDCQRLCVLGGQTAPAVQTDAVTPANIVAPGQCPDGNPLGGNAPVLCGNSTDSIGCPTGYYCRGGPPDICCPGVDPALRNVQHGVKLVPETTPTPGVPRSYYKEKLLSTPKYMCPDASDPLMAENNEPAVCGAGFDGVKMCPKGYYCAIDGAKGSRLCCPLFGSPASRIPHEYNVIAPSTLRKSSTSREVVELQPLPSDQEKYIQANRKVELPPQKSDDEEEEEYEDDDAAQQLKIKNSSRNRELQEQAASESPKAADVSSETVNIDIPKEEPAVEETTQPTEAPVKHALDRSVCQLKPTEGRACRENEKTPRTNLHYFYSAKDRRCKLYFYRGCGGSDNRFEKKADCEALCLSP